MTTLRRGTSTIEQTRIVRASPEAVYRALSDARVHSAVTGARATGQSRPGARFTAWDGYITGKTLVCDPGRRLVQEWSTTEWPPDTAPSRVEWRFRPHPRGSRVTLRHTGVPRTQVSDLRGGWIQFYWQPLREYFAARREKTARR